MNHVCMQDVQLLHDVQNYWVGPIPSFSLPLPPVFLPVLLLARLLAL